MRDLRTLIESASANPDADLFPRGFEEECLMRMVLGVESIAKSLEGLISRIDSFTVEGDLHVHVPEARR